MKRFPFPRYGRLLLKRDFEMVYTRGSRLSNRYLSIYSIETTRPYPRIGFSISKKIKKASSRNRVKRILREIYRLNRPRLKGGVDIVVVARHESDGLDFHSLEECLLQLFKENDLFIKEENACKDSALSN